MILSTGFVYLGWNYFLVLGHPPHCGKFPRGGDLADIWSRVDQIWSDIRDVRGDHMAQGIMARLLGHRMTRTKVRRACRRKCSGKASLINSNVLAALVRCCHTSVKYRSPRLSSWIFPISTLLHSLSGARGRRIRIHWESWQSWSESLRSDSRLFLV